MAFISLRHRIIFTCLNSTSLSLISVYALVTTATLQRAGSHGERVSPSLAARTRCLPVISPGKKKKTQALEDTSSGAARVRPTLHASSVPKFVLVYSSDAEEGQKMSATQGARRALAFSVGSATIFCSLGGITRFHPSAQIK